LVKERVLRARLQSLRLPAEETERLVKWVKLTAAGLRAGNTT